MFSMKPIVLRSFLTLYQSDLPPLYLPRNNPIQKKPFAKYCQQPVPLHFTPPQMIKTVARINLQLVASNSKLVTAAPIFTKGWCEII
jgi:hypothetical protein